MEKTHEKSLLDSREISNQSFLSIYTDRKSGEKLMGS